MIKINNEGVGSILYNNRPILFVYINGQKVWGADGTEPVIPDNPDEPILDTQSCYYNGYWIDIYPWTDDTPWTD